MPAPVPFRLPDRSARFWRLGVLVTLLIGLLLLGLSVWLLIGSSGFSSRAVITNAVIDEIYRGPVDDTPDGIARWTVYAKAHYDIDGEPVHARIVLGRCQSSCLFSYEGGETVQVGYDPDHVRSAVLATGGHVPKASGRAPWLSGLLGFAGLGSVAAGLLNARLT